MAQSCLVPTCDSRKGDENISLFRFPKDPSRREQWFQICGLTLNHGPKDPKICSLHFSPSDVEIRGRHKHCSLKQTALPKIFKNEEMLILSENPPPLVALHKPRVAGNRNALQNIVNQIGALRPAVKVKKPYIVVKTPYHVLRAGISLALKRDMSALPPLSLLKTGAIAAPRNHYHDCDLLSLHSESGSEEDVTTKEMHPNVAFRLLSSIAKADGKICEKEHVSKFVQTDTALCQCGADALAEEVEDLKRRNAELERQNSYLARSVTEERIKLESTVLRYQNLAKRRETRVKSLRQQIRRLRLTIKNL